MENVQIANSKLIYEASKSQKLVIIVGSGVSKNSGIPIWNELLKEMKKDLPDSVKEEYDALKVAQLYKNTFGTKDTIEKVKSVLHCDSSVPNDIHKAIFDLNPAHIITTNYDNLIECEAEILGKSYSTLRRDMDIPYATYNRYIIKMHGDFVNNNIVLTEEDYINYFNNFPLIASIVQSLFASKTVLCVGYSFSDPDLKMLLNIVKRVLKKDTPRVFLLGNYTCDSVNERYLQDQGVFPIWLDNKTIEKYGLENNNLVGKGKEVYKHLCAFKTDLTVPDNLIDEWYDIFYPIAQEMPYLVFGMKNLIPSDYYKMFYLYSEGLQLNSPQIKEISQRIKSKSGLKRMVEGRIDKVKFLLELAQINGIFRLDDLNLYETKVFKQNGKRHVYDSIDYIYEFNFPKAYEKIEQIQQSPLTYTYHDLELPFAYWSLGYYTKAFQKYQYLGENYRKSKNHILYFLCLHSQRMLANAVEFENTGISLVDIKNDLKKIRNTNFNDLIDDLNIPDDLRAIFTDIANFRMYLDVVTDAKHTEREIFEDKHRYEHGGCSINNNIPSLASNICRVFNFSNQNFVISMNNRYSGETFKSGLTGLLLSHSMKETENRLNFQQSKLDIIEKSLVLFMIFTLDNNSLKQIFIDYDIDTITLREDAVKYLETCIGNIDKVSCSRIFGNSQINEYIKNDRFVSQLTNLVLICAKATNKISNIDKFTNILINNKLVDRRGKLIDSYRILLAKDKIVVTEDQANTIFEMFPSDSKNEPILESLSQYMMRNNIQLKNEDTDFLQSNTQRGPFYTLKSIGIIYPIALPKVKETIERWINGSDFEKYDEYCWIEFWWFAKHHCRTIVNQKNVDAYIEYKASHQIGENAVLITWLIASIANDEAGEGVVSKSMTELNDDMYNFFLNPNSVEDVKVKDKWILFLRDTQLKDYLSVTEHKNRVGELLNGEGEDVEELKNRIIKQYLS